MDPDLGYVTKWESEVYNYKEIKPKGYVALGVPGSGKTTMAEAIAKKIMESLNV